MERRQFKTILSLRFIVLFVMFITWIYICLWFSRDYDLQFGSDWFLRDNRYHYGFDIMCWLAKFVSLWGCVLVLMIGDIINMVYEDDGLTCD